MHASQGRWPLLGQMSQYLRGLWRMSEIVHRFAKCFARAKDICGGQRHVPSSALLNKLKSAGLQIREYHLQPGGSVNCTIAPEDDLVVSHLRAPLAGVQRLDLVLEDVDAALQFRVLTSASIPQVAKWW